jgi:cyclopropane-fatty-acyl-phospholipid synthase
MLAARLLTRLVREDGIVLIDADGRRHVFGRPSNPDLTVRLKDRRLHRHLFFSPALAFGEAYMDGRLVIEGGSLHDVLDVFGRSLGTAAFGALDRFAAPFPRLLQWLTQRNPLRRARRNVAHHYDLSDELYRLFLDADRQYSCAYFERPDATLEEAQAAKKRHIAAKLLLRPGQRVLDIGSGWGGLAIHLAREAGVEVVGLTLSQEQHRLATARAEAAGLADRVRFILRDYREETGTYDRIVSVGMFEHVGAPHYREFFRTVSRLLADDGVMLLHAIGRMDGPGRTNPWLAKYIFPGGYCPALSEVFPPIEAARLWPTDVEILRLHYAETLRVWRERFAARRDDAARLYDERFCRMWEFYLAACEVAFRRMGQLVFQIQLAKRAEAVPITRDYVDAWKRAHPLEAAGGPGSARAA